MTSVITADDGYRIHVAEHGDPTGRPVVLLAGFKAPATTWRHQVRSLVDAGCRVLAVDVRGHGEAEPIGRGVTMARRADDVAAVLEQLDVQGATLVGGSMGGNTIWAYVERHGTDRIRAIAIVDQTPRMLNDAEWPHGYYGYETANRDTFFAEGIPPTGVGTPIWRRGMRLVRLVRAMGTPGRSELTPGELDVLGDHARADWRPTIARTEVPVLFVAGAESELWPATHAAAAAALAPRGESAVILQAGHATNMEQPAAFDRGLLEWLART
ncbi:alpha/beta fold hydrolase [Agrococcus jejuensis]|uniref:Pimeloyl-ACP methyl ester carboxylesterase n=1 Tax=Agrococcus jejuensis TaxID=399736 RepID=A0A1G8CIG4_9MICO|nr:alpha/beta hydrolase [Agrococcus jejuensis]SDH45208.1 Pimeloyl-ACP methyl ester carboxylesterase [Agrococcus jejuensis]